MSDQGSSPYNIHWTSKAATGDNVHSVGSPVHSRIYVSCYITAASRATPIFEVHPQHNCVRLAKKVLDGEKTSSNWNDLSSAGNSMVGPSVEWKFHAVFSSNLPSHAIDFYTKITLPALRAAQEGINSNIIVWDVHPKHKCRLLFGKCVNGGGFAPQPTMAVNEVVEVYGQLVGMLHTFFAYLDHNSQKNQEGKIETWRLGISSWIFANNQTIDLLKTVDTTRTSTSGDLLAFVSLEAPSLAAAFRIVQTAKANCIVRGKNAENAHFFVRLALFHGGQVSTVHLADLIDTKDRQDHVWNQENSELYPFFKDLRQSMLGSKRAADSQLHIPDKTLLSNFMMPLLTANATTFLYAIVIDSRANLRESVQMLNAGSNLQGFKCICKPLCGASFDQLCFTACPIDTELDLRGSDDRYTPVLLDSCSEILPQCIIKRAQTPSLVQNRIPANQSSIEHQTMPFSPNKPKLSEAKSWLNSFTLRKRDILAGSVATIDAITSSLRISERILPTAAPIPATESPKENKLRQQSSTLPKSHPSTTNLHDRLRESLEDVEEIKLSRLKHSRESLSSLRYIYSDRSTPESRTPLKSSDQSANCHDYAQIAFNESTSNNIAHLQAKQSQQQLGKGRSYSSNSAAINPSILNLPCHFRDVSDANSRSLVAPAKMLMPAPPADSSMPIFHSATSKLDNVTLEALKRAGVSSYVMEAPNVDGLDVETVEKIQAADATLLRKNYDALLAIVREQQQAKDAAQTRAAEALQDQEEMRAMFAIQIENMKLENVGLRSKLRALENHTPFSQILKQYEQDLDKFHAQVQALQAQNADLELRTSELGRVEIGSNQSLIDLKKKYRKNVEENLKLEREVMEYRKRERQHQVHSRLIDASTRRVDQLLRYIVAAADRNIQEEVLTATRLSKQRLSAERTQALEKADKLQRENGKLLQEKATTSEELIAARIYLASLENEEKKTAILDHFVKKHGDRMNKYGQHGQSSSERKSKGWRRDHHAHKCEDRLLAALKMALPQAVPLCNKLLCRLELQELSLREFSDREVVLINLLVELVSDKSAVSLKDMIEQEMKNLHYGLENNVIH